MLAGLAAAKTGEYSGCCSRAHVECMLQRGLPTACGVQAVCLAPLRRACERDKAALAFLPATAGVRSRRWSLVAVTLCLMTAPGVALVKS